MKKILASTVVIIIFVVILFILNSRSGIAPVVTNTPVLTSPSIQKDSPPNKFDSGKFFEILISENGLSKNNLSLKTGDTVRFINNDPVLHWPASGPHPTHQLCPKFDALRGLKLGETYSFTFNKAISCPFHDHLNTGAQYRGTITVTE
jgi:plastocyanin